MNGAVWAGRLGIIIAIIIIEKASPALAWFLVLACALAWLGYGLWNGDFLTKTQKDWLLGLVGRGNRDDGPIVIDPERFAAELKDQIIGQDEVIDQIATQLRRRLAARRPDKPIAVLCFAGPPGVGKTELAKVLTEALYPGRQRLHFFSLAELGRSESAAATLFGHPGSLGDGTLTSALLREPQAVVLLDEIEKANPEVLKRFLSAWNDGFVTDQKSGAKSDTSKAIFILTTNANQREIGELVASHAGTTDELNRKVKDMLSVGEKALAPEVLSRIDTVFAFRPMKGIDIAYVVALQIEKLAKSYGLEVAGGGIKKEILLDAVERLEKIGTKGGVRDIAREIEEKVADGLIDAKASGAKEVRFEVEGTLVKVVPADGKAATAAGDKSEASAKAEA
jgi:ATP-dependent Clp protease ATP-binding subunit ClpA